MNEEQRPIYDEDAENSVIGSVLIDNQSLDSISFLQPKHFFRDKNMWIFEKIRELEARGDAINQITVAHELERSGKLEAIGGMAYMSGLLMDVPTSVHCEYYAKIVWRMAANRELQTVSGRIESMAAEARPVFSDTLSEAIESLAKLHNEFTLSEDHTTYHREGIISYQDMQRDSSIKPWLTTPWVSYNDKVRLRSGTVSVIAGPTSMGKTMWCEQVADHVAKDLGKNVLYLLNELEPRHLFHRRACRMMTTTAGRAPTFTDLEDGVYSESDEMEAFVADVANWPGNVTIVECAGWPVHRICSEIKQKASEGLADAVILDYLQRVPIDDLMGKGINSARAVGTVVDRIKTACLSIPDSPPVIIASQLRRGLPITSKADLSSDLLKESGDIENLSNQITFVWNQWDASHGACLKSCNENRGTADGTNCLRRCLWLVTTKNTFGMKNEVLLKVIPHRYKFVEDNHDTKRMLWLRGIQADTVRVDRLD